MDKTIQIIKVFAVEDNGNGFVTSLGEFRNLEDLVIRPADFDKDVVINFESYWIGGDE